MKKHQVIMIGILSIFSLFIISPIVFAQILPVQRNVAVTALVPPRALDFQFSFNANKDGEINQDTTIAYEMSYGASSSAGVSTTTQIVVNFGEDIAPEGSHVLDYVVGSATNAYGGVQPVVDLQNRTLTWIIPNMPAGTVNQKVRFELKTNQNYSGLQTVNFTIKASLGNEYTTLPDKTITHSFKYRQNLTTPSEESETTISPTPTVTPSVAPSRPQISAVEVPSITDTSASIAVATSPPTSVTIRYGTSPNALTQTIRSTGRNTNHLLELNGLTPDTIYYFQIVATDAQGNTRVSEIITFTTARKSQAPLLTNNGIVITSGDQVILSDILNGNSVPFGIITTQTNYALTYTFSQETSLSNFEVIIRDRQGNETRTAHLNQKDLRVYTAFLKSSDAGLYDVYVRLTDAQGNIVEQKVALMKSVRRFQVLEQNNNTPIADARVFLSKLNPATNRFEALDFGTNPSFTNTSGEINTILPKGKYRAEISALLYGNKTIDFTLGEFDGQDFPTIYLERDPFNIAALINFLRNMLSDSFAGVANWLGSLATSTRFNSIMSGAAVGSFALLSSLLFSFRTEIRWRDLLPFFMFNLLAVVKKHREAYLYGIVTGPDKEPISKARIEVIDMKTNTVLTHALTNKSGRFVIKNIFKQQYIKFQIIKDGFAEREASIATDTKKLIEIKLGVNEHKQPTIVRGIRHTLGELFELLLLLSLIAELIFLFHFGIAKTLPFFLLSVTNLLLWIFFQREKNL